MADQPELLVDDDNDTADRTRRSPDKELSAMRRILDVLDDLPNDQAARRVLDYVYSRVVAASAVTLPATCNGGHS